MASAISALLFLDSKGKPVLFRDYRCRGLVRVADRWQGGVFLDLALAEIGSIECFLFCMRVFVGWACCLVVPFFQYR